MTLSLTGLVGFAAIAGVIVILIRRILARRAEAGQRRAATDGMPEDHSWHDHTPEATHPVNTLALVSDGAAASCETAPSSGGDAATSSSCDSSSSSPSSD